MRDLRVSLILVPSLLPALRSTASADRATSPSPNDVFRSVHGIVTADGIQDQRMPHIGGIDQRISIRGLHPDNPILLFLHGGPGMTSIPASDYYIAGWEEYLTLVQWDQRGAGRTYLAHDPAEERPSMTVDRMVADTRNW